MFADIYKGKRVFVTGHTGFKGSWLSFWLLKAGAEVCGYSDCVPTTPSNFEVLGLKDRMTHVLGDIRDRERLKTVMTEYKPDIVFHLAAQALVRKSYRDPVATYETNAMGTLNVLESIRATSSVNAAVLITSDKCYRNVEWPWGYRETDALGGEDPYSASKGCAELIIYSYIHSFFKEGAKIANTRAGNVIGGGDWAEDRIAPDAVRAWSKNESLIIRSPRATRPWQHVLEPLSGYLWLGACLLNDDRGVAGEAFNFGPDANVNQSVEELLVEMKKHWPGGQWEIDAPADNPAKESTLLKLCCDKALHMLNWRACLDFSETVEMTASWYRMFYDEKGCDMSRKTDEQIDFYIQKAKKLGISWAS